VTQQLQGTANANYNALAVKLQRRFARDLTCLVSYTWSKSMDYDSGPRPPANEVANPNNNYDLHPEWALSGFNVAHRFVTSLVYELPVARRNRFAGGWQLGSILTMQSGFLSASGMAWISPIPGTIWIVPMPRGYRPDFPIGLLRSGSIPPRTRCSHSGPLAVPGGTR